jgi:hypothetical protein
MGDQQGGGVPVPVPGTGTLEWADNFVPAQPLCVPDDKLPRAAGSTKGFLATANSDPLGVSEDNDPIRETPAASPTSATPGTTAWGSASPDQDVLSATIADARTVSLDDMHALQTDHVMYLARPFWRRSLLPTRCTRPTPTPAAPRC